MVSTSSRRPATLGGSSNGNADEGFPRQHLNRDFRRQLLGADPEERSSSLQSSADTSPGRQTQQQCHLARVIVISGPTEIAYVDRPRFVSNARQNTRWFPQGRRQPPPLFHHISIVQSNRRRLSHAHCSFPCSSCTSRD